MQSLSRGVCGGGVKGIRLWSMGRGPRESVVHGPECSCYATVNAAKKVNTDEISKFWYDKVKSLLVQGRFLDLLCTEAKAYHWKSILFNLPVGVCKFVINSLCDTLNNKVNLKRWGKALNDKCCLCKNRATLHHILNHCSVSLEQERFTWHYNNILQHIYKTITSGFHPDNSPEILCDIKEFAKGKPTTAPIECSVTNLIPDLCLFWKACKKLVIIELTVSFELNIEKAHKGKVDKCTALELDVKSKGFECDILLLKLGAEGMYPLIINSVWNLFSNCAIILCCSKTSAMISASSPSFLHFPSTTLTRNRLGIITLGCQFLEVEFVFAPRFKLLSFYVCIVAFVYALRYFCTRITVLGF